MRETEKRYVEKDMLDTEIYKYTSIGDRNDGIEEL